MLLLFSSCSWQLRPLSLWDKIKGNSAVTKWTVEVLMGVRGRIDERIGAGSL